MAQLVDRYWYYLSKVGSFFIKMKKKKETYAEMLKDPRWQKKRLEIMQRDNFTCQHCGCKTNTLHVHHMNYRKTHKPWEYEDCELITLCDKCHDYEHDESESLYPTFLELKNTFKENGFSMSLLTSLIGYLCSICYEKDERCDRADEYVKAMIYGTQNYKDAVAATKIGINCRSLIQVNFPQMLEDFDKEVGYEGE